MKKIISAILMVMSAISLVACKFWIIVSFILYIAKDTPFNWWSIWTWVISLLVLIPTYFIYLFSVSKSIENKLSTPSKKSSFQERLEEMEQKRKQSKL